MSTKTTDLCDEFINQLQVAEPIFRDLGGTIGFHGPIATVKAFEDNSLVRTALESAGDGRVLVVDAGGSQRCAMLGDMLAELAHRNGWVGVVLYGCIRDSAEIGRIPVGVKAMGIMPNKSQKRGEGQRDIPVRFAGVEFRPGAYLYADEDGLIVADRRLDG